MSRRSNNRQAPLTDRDQAILEHVARHRITTNEVVRKLFFPRRQPNAVTKVTARLVAEGCLQKFPLIRPRVYFVLGPAAAGRLGVSAYRTQDLGPQSLPTEYAALAYAALGSGKHVRLTARELREQYPWLPEPLVRQPHCSDRASPVPCLELIRADLGGAADHVARKCDEDVHERCRYPEFAALLAKAAFRLVVITGTADKAAAVRAALEHRLFPDGVRIHLAVVPDLFLLTGVANDAP